MIVAALLLGYSLRRLGLLVAAAVATGALELAFGAIRWGRPLIHLQQLLQHGDEDFGKRAETVAIVQRGTQDPLDALRVLPRLILSWDSGWPLLLLAPIFVVALVFLRDRRLWVLATWCFGFWATMVLLAMGELPSGRWIINVSNIRYWYPVFPALAMGGLGGLWLLVRTRFIRSGAPCGAAGADDPPAGGSAPRAKGVWRNTPLRQQRKTVPKRVLNMLISFSMCLAVRPLLPDEPAPRGLQRCNLSPLNGLFPVR